MRRGAEPARGERTFPLHVPENSGAGLHPTAHALQREQSFRAVASSESCTHNKAESWGLLLRWGQPFVQICRISVAFSNGKITQGHVSRHRHCATEAELLAPVRPCPGNREEIGSRQGLWGTFPSRLKRWSLATWCQLARVGMAHSYGGRELTHAQAGTRRLRFQVRVESPMVLP